MSEGRHTHQNETLQFGTHISDSKRGFIRGRSIVRWVALPYCASAKLRSQPGVATTTGAV